MTVAELIRELHKFPPLLEVFVDYGKPIELVAYPCSHPEHRYKTSTVRIYTKREGENI